MEKSQSIKNLASALIQFHLKVDVIKKDASNPFYKNTYASLSNILSCIDIPLTESGLCYSQFPSGQNGLTTILMHAESGEYLQSEYIMPPSQNSPQGIGSAITYQRRYALAAILGLNIDEDDDGNAASNNQSQSYKKEDNNNLPWLNEDMKEFAGAIKKLKAGETTIEKISLAFRLSKSIREKLQAATKN